MDTSPSSVKEFDVTGVSRSGRVRKKSSKLLDFQSPDELLEKKPKRSTTHRTPTRGSVRGRRPLPDTGWKHKSSSQSSSALDDVAADDDELVAAATDDNNEFDTSHNESHFRPTDEDDDEDELDELVADIVEGVEAEAESNANESKVQQSLYMTEQKQKKKILKDGRLVSGKIQRKDKGKTRCTAYSMWAREYRKSGKFGHKQDLDFANSARRLTELWANVPNNEKNMWRRKAKRVALKPTKSQESNETQTAAGVNSAASNLFLNRATTSRTKKLAADKQNAPAATSRRTRRDTAHNNNNASNITHNAKGGLQRTNNSSSSNNALQTNTNNNSVSANNSTKLPMSGIAPIDAAAHLKLLGESLTIIGERLKEHEGQITVSGSLSVLLDSLLCSVGPLLCLTTRIPGLEHRKQLNDNLIATLDNIAYVMPGL